MEAKLKTLKVPDLKEVLTRAGETIPAKSTKPSLIAQILGSSSALSAYEELHGGGSSKPAIATSSPTPAASAVVEPPAAISKTKASPALSKPNTPAISSTPSTTQKTDPKTTTSMTSALSSDSDSTPKPTKEDDEIAKRRARAERFGIEFVEKPVAKSKGTSLNGSEKNSAKKAASAVLTEDPEKIKARAARFGIDVAKQSAGSKRTAPTEEIDPEEAERRRKRAERFGLKA